jgi:hypothetical protein
MLEVITPLRKFIHAPSQGTSIIRGGSRICFNRRKRVCLTVSKGIASISYSLGEPLSVLNSQVSECGLFLFFVSFHVMFRNNIVRILITLFHVAFFALTACNRIPSEVRDRIWNLYSIHGIGVYRTFHERRPFDSHIKPTARIAITIRQFTNLIDICFLCFQVLELIFMFRTYWVVDHNSKYDTLLRGVFNLSNWQRISFIKPKQDIGNLSPIFINTFNQEPSKFWVLK